MTVPDGSAESFDSSVDWIACNMAHEAWKWDTARQRAANFGVKVFPWVRLCHIQLGEDFETIKERLNLLVATAQAWGTDTIIPNYENEADFNRPADVADYLYDMWDGNVGWSTLAWIQNSVDWTPIAHDPVLLQIFPKDNNWTVDEIAQKQRHCVRHAREEGFTYVGVTFQTYADAQPSWYDVSGSHSVFPGNVIAHGQWDDWFPA